LEHFKKLQGNLEIHQNKCHPGDVHDTRRQCAKVVDQWAQVVAGDTLQEAVERNPKLKISGG
jgi:hypothetical protein